MSGAYGQEIVDLADAVCDLEIFSFSISFFSREILAGSMALSVYLRTAWRALTASISSIILTVSYNISNISFLFEKYRVLCVLDEFYFLFCPVCLPLSRLYFAGKR